MNLKKRLIGLAAAAVMATGILATTAAPSDAAAGSGTAGIHMLDTGWP